MQYKEEIASQKEGEQRYVQYAQDLPPLDFEFEPACGQVNDTYVTVSGHQINKRDININGNALLELTKILEGIE